MNLPLVDRVSCAVNPPQFESRDLEVAFQNEDFNVRDNWHSNPRKIPDDVIRILPRMVIVAADLDILFPSQLALKTRLEAQSVSLSWIVVNGLHQVKDLDQVTEAGCEVKQRVLHESKIFVR